MFSRKDLFRNCGHLFLEMERWSIIEKDVSKVNSE